MPQPSSRTPIGAQPPFKLAEGILSVILTVAVPFAPALKISAFTTYEMSMFDLVISLSRYMDYLDKYGAYVVIMAVLMITATVSSAINAVCCFTGKSVISNTATHWTVAAYSAFVLIVLMYLSHETYGIGGASGWVWFTLVGGIVNGVLNFMSRSSSVLIAS